MKWKMRRKLIIALITVVLLVAYGLLAIDYAQQRRGHEELTVSLAEMTRQLQQIPAPPQGLEQKLAAAEASLAATQSAFPARPNSTQIINRILKLADERQVKVIPLATQEWSLDRTGTGYLVFGLQLTVQGGFYQFVNFLNQLESGDFGALIIQDLSVTRTTDNTSAQIPVIASLEVAIYSRSAPPD